MSKASDRTHEAKQNGQLTEEDIRRIAQEETAVKTSDGETVRLADLVDVLGNRRLAIGAFGLVALGATVGGAVSAVSTTTGNAVSSSGDGTVTADEVVANLLTADEVETDALSGIAGEADEITEIVGDIIVDEEEPDYRDGALWLEKGEEE